MVGCWGDLIQGSSRDNGIRDQDGNYWRQDPLNTTEAKDVLEFWD